MVKPFLSFGELFDSDQYYLYYAALVPVGQTMARPLLPPLPVVIGVLGFLVPIRAFTTVSCRPYTSSCNPITSVVPHHGKAVVSSASSSPLHSHLFDSDALLSATQATHALTDQSALSLSGSVVSESTSAGISSVSSLLSTAATQPPPTTAPPNVEALSNETNVAVFLIGLIPFAWATIEFWRRIAVGASFGTGSDSVVISIGEDDNPTSSRGRQVLGSDALAVAYVLFGVAALSVGLAVFSVVTAPPPVADLPR
mmetsp:Transcript_10895/g.23599  ORF Transcript_10895/g.23599 Transcript_10895/m.23599 type:complete len:255 (-) Transcript_10895:1683-2447(-)